MKRGVSAEMGIPDFVSSFTQRKNKDEPHVQKRRIHLAFSGVFVIKSDTFDEILCEKKLRLSS